MVGTYSEAKHFGFVIPDDKRIMQDIFIPKGQSLGARWSKYLSKSQNMLMAQIIQKDMSAILGHKMTQE